MIFLSRIHVVGHSMQPTISSGQSVLVSGIPYVFKNPKVGDIVLVKGQGKKHLVKRIARIQNNTYFVRGDNPKDSLDSKDFGVVERKNLIAKVLVML